MMEIIVNKFLPKVTLKTYLKLVDFKQLNPTNRVPGPYTRSSRTYAIQVINHSNHPARNTLIQHLICLFVYSRHVVIKLY